jgi:hypothetical protein
MIGIACARLLETTFAITAVSANVEEDGSQACGIVW